MGSEIKIIEIFKKHGVKGLFLACLNFNLIRIFNLKLVKHNNLNFDKKKQKFI